MDQKNQKEKSLELLKKTRELIENKADDDFRALVISAMVKSGANDAEMEVLTSGVGALKTVRETVRVSMLRYLEDDPAAAIYFVMSILQQQEALYAGKEGKSKLH